MKKLVITIIVSILLLTSLQKTFAQDISSDSQVPSVQYDLPYPGLLPDNPLYFLKAIRDNLLGAFITDPLKKADFTLLQADKRLAASKALFNNKKYDLAITTLSKSGNYFDQAINKAADAKRAGQNANPILERLLIASKKHQEVIFQMEEKTKGQTKYSLELLRNRTKDFQDIVEVLKSS